MISEELLCSRLKGRHCNTSKPNPWHLYPFMFMDMTVRGSSPAFSTLKLFLTANNGLLVRRPARDNQWRSVSVCLKIELKCKLSHHPDTPWASTGERWSAERLQGRATCRPLWVALWPRGPAPSSCQRLSGCFWKNRLKTQTLAQQFLTFSMPDNSNSL